MQLLNRALRALSRDRSVWVVAALAAAGTLWCGSCTGSVGPSGSSAGAGGGPVTGGGSGGSASFGSCQPTADPGVTPLTKLSTLQYRNTVRDLLAADWTRDELTVIVDDESLNIEDLPPAITGDELVRRIALLDAPASRRTA